MCGDSPTRVSYDIHETADRLYSGRVRPLRVTVVALAIGLAGAEVVLVSWKGLNAFTLVFGGGTAAFLVFAWWALRSVLTRGPTGIRLSPHDVELQYADGRDVPIPYRTPGTRIELTDLASASILGKQAAWGEVPWLLEINGGPLIALNSESLAALRDFLNSHALRLDYSGTYHGLSGSHVWRFVS